MSRAGYIYLDLSASPEQALRQHRGASTCVHSNTHPRYRISRYSQHSHAHEPMQNQHLRSRCSIRSWYIYSPDTHDPNASPTYAWDTWLLQDHVLVCCAVIARPEQWRWRGVRDAIRCAYGKSEEAIQSPKRNSVWVLGL